MKQLIFGLAIVLAACNTNTTDTKNSDSAAAAKMEPATSATTGTSAKDIVEHYLHVKNALTKDDSKDAADGGAALAASFASFDASVLNATQKKSFDDIAGVAKEHAEHISKNAGNLVHQREHFASLSKDVYDFVKAFGAGQTLYQDFCPMYNKSKGAIWLSETKDIKNPYYGKEMPDCGSVKETIQ